MRLELLLHVFEHDLFAPGIDIGSNQCPVDFLRGDGAHFDLAGRSLVNGLFAPDQGLFPQYAGGRYDVNGTTLIVSRGLAKESTRLPRFYNRPELVIVELL